jgi:hypothetical protein
MPRHRPILHPKRGQIEAIALRPKTETPAARRAFFRRTNPLSSGTRKTTHVARQISLRRRIMAAKSNFRGSFTALATPFKNGSVDEAAFRALVNWQIAEGTHGLVPVGTTGESPTLSHDEHRRVVEWCVAEAKGRVPVIAGTGSNSTQEAIELSRHAEKAGASGVLVVTPYYNKPTQEGLYQHYKAINDAIGIPIIIYNIPSRSVIDMSVETMKRLFELRNITGVKDATASVTRISQRPWRPRLHLGDLERRAAAVLGIPEGVPGRRLQDGARAQRQAVAAARQPVRRDQSVAGEIRAVAARQVRGDGAAADGSAVGIKQVGGQGGDGARRLVELTRGR